MNRLLAFVDGVDALRGWSLADRQADRLTGQAEVILGCMASAAGGRPRGGR